MYMYICTHVHVHLHINTTWCWWSRCGPVSNLFHSTTSYRLFRWWVMMFWMMWVVIMTADLPSYLQCTETLTLVTKLRPFRPTPWPAWNWLSKLSRIKLVEGLEGEVAAWIRLHRNRCHPHTMFWGQRQRASTSSPHHQRVSLWCSEVKQLSGSRVAQVLEQGYISVCINFLLYNTRLIPRLSLSLSPFLKLSCVGEMYKARLKRRERERERAWGQGYYNTLEIAWGCTITWVLYSACVHVHTHNYYADNKFCACCSTCMYITNVSRD